MKTFWDNFKEVLINLFHSFGWAWWVEIVTQSPHCTYYFGPFLSVKEANGAKSGYVEDLEQEGAQGIIVTVKRCKPSHLTIFDELGDRIDRNPVTVFSGQM
jgi:Fe-S oxidoreductase